jgi:AP-2 complex subunit mu-1
MQVLAAKEFRSPVQVFEKASFFHIRSSNVYIVAATRENVNAAMVFQFLFALVEVFNGYFGGAFEEETVRDNFPLVYELLDEVMDFGYPQSCSTDMLKTFIMQEGQSMDPARKLVVSKPRSPARCRGAGKASSIAKTRCSSTWLSMLTCSCRRRGRFCEATSLGKF